MLTVDDREVTQHPELPELLKLPPGALNKERLDSGDYAFLDYAGEPVCIERCEVSNLVQKLRSGELETQLTRCDESYKSIILLTEGVYDSFDGLLATYKAGNRGYFRTFIFPHTYYDYVLGALIRLSDMGIELVHTPDFPSSMVAVRTIYSQRTKTPEESTLFKRIRPVRIPVKLSANPAIPKLMALCPRMPEKVAIRLINQYDSIWNILNTGDKELLETEGMGKGLVVKLRRGVGQ